jgi:6-phosphofructokinase 1
MSFIIERLGESIFRSPLLDKFRLDDTSFANDNRRMFYNVMLEDFKADTIDLTQTFELAGARKYIYFQPEETKSAIVTCGGLSPGLNDVIRSIVMESWYRYGAKDILGIMYGYNGLHSDAEFKPIVLDPELVKEIHMDGGSILGSSRGGTDDMELLVK